MTKNTHRLGEMAEYIDSKQHPKLAMVIAVPGQIKPGSNLTPLPKGFYNITVYSPSGSAYVRGEVPDYETAKGIKDCLDSDGNPSNFVRVLEDHFEAPDLDDGPLVPEDKPKDEPKTSGDDYQLPDEEEDDFGL